MKLSAIFSITFAFVQLSQSLNILGVFVYPDQNHWTVYNAFMEELSKRGHNLTVITNYPTRETTSSYREIHIKPFYSPEVEVADRLNLKNIYEIRHLDSRKIINLRFEMGLSATEHCLKAKDVKEFLTRIKLDAPFDLMIVGDYYQEALLYLSELLDCPVVGVNPSLPHPISYYWTGLGGLNIYTFHDLLDFTSETKDTSLAVYANKQYLETYLPKQESLLNEHFNLELKTSGHIPKFYRRVMFTLSNYYNFLYPPSPIMGRSYIPVGGLYIRAPKELPTDIKTFLHDANYGAIFVIMPSRVYGLNMDMEILNRLMVSFSSLKQKVLLQWDGPKIVDLPKNVFVRRWIPTSCVLAHPYVQLLICPGDIWCVQHSIQRMVPMIAIPITKEQDKSTQIAEVGGFGRRLALDNISADNVTKTIQELFGNLQYIEKVHKAAVLHKDSTLLGAMEEAAYWIEFAAKHRIFKDTIQDTMTIPADYSKVIYIGLITLTLLILCIGGLKVYKVYFIGFGKRDKKAV